MGSIKRLHSKAKSAKINNYSMYVYLLVIITFLVIVIFLCLPSKSKSNIKLDINGSDSITLSLGSKYVEEGSTLTKNNKKVDSNVTISGEVPDKVGTYEITYSTTYEDKTYTATRNVSVIDDIKPEIIVNNSSISFEVCDGKNVNNLSYVAYDNYDGIITDKVNVVENENSYTLSVMDSSNNENSVEVIKNVNNDNPYIISLNGKFIEYLQVGNEYIDKGAMLTDLCGNSIASDVLVDGVVDINTPGIYRLKYYYNDDIFAYRIVVVYEKTQSEKKDFTGSKVIYLTFDDGPGQYTEQILDILDKYNVKATFFVTNQFSKYVTLIQKEYEDGNAIGIHSLTHNWNIYQSFENYYKDFNDMDSIIYSYTNEHTKLFRFPGGSSNTVSKGKSTGIMSYAISRMNEMGYTYYDWNVDSEDAAGANSTQVYNNVISGISNRNYSVVLMHDIKQSTLNCLENIIVYALDNGYTFDKLSNDSPIVHHHVNN